MSPNNAFALNNDEITADTPLPMWLAVDFFFMILDKGNDKVSRLIELILSDNTSYGTLCNPFPLFDQRLFVALRLSYNVVFGIMSQYNKNELKLTLSDFYAPKKICKNGYRNIEYFTGVCDFVKHHCVIMLSCGDSIENIVVIFQCQSVVNKICDDFVHNYN